MSAEKLGQIGITTSFFKRATPNSSTESVVLEVCFHKKAIISLARANISDRYEIIFGSGKNLGNYRIYFNKPIGSKLLSAGSFTRATVAVTENSVFQLYAAHRKDVKSLQHQAILYRCAGELYLEVMLMPAAFEAEKLQRAVTNLYPIQSKEGWFKYQPKNLQFNSNKRKAASAKPIQPATVKLGTFVDETVRKVAETKIHTSGDYLRIPMGDNEEAWVKRELINLNFFRVKDNKPIVKIDGNDVQLDIPVELLLSAVSG